MTSLRRTTSTSKPETVVQLEPMLHAVDLPTPSASSSSELKLHRCSATDCQYAATTSCAVCNAFICVEHMKRTEMSNYSRRSNLEVCTKCYEDEIQNQKSCKILLFWIIGLIGVVLLLLFLIKVANSY